MGSWPAEVGFSPVLSLKSPSTNKGNWAPITGTTAGGTGEELDSRRTRMGGVTGESICRRIWILTAHQLWCIAGQSCLSGQVVLGKLFFSFSPPGRKLYFFLYSWAQSTPYDKGRKCFILATSSWVLWDVEQFRTWPHSWLWLFSAHKLFRGKQYAWGLYLQHLRDYLGKGRFSIHVHWWYKKYSSVLDFWGGQCDKQIHS